MAANPTELVKSVLGSLWGFLWAHRYACGVVLAGVLAFAYVRKHDADAASTIKDLNDSHQVAITQIAQAQEQADKERAAELQTLQDSLAKAKTDYDAAKAELKKQQVQEQHKIVTQYGDDMDGLAKLAADKLGLIVLPIAQ